MADTFGMDAAVDELAGNQEGYPGFEEAYLAEEPAREIREVEWIIPPDQFVETVVAVIFIMVGIWQIITILFLLNK